MPSEDSHVSLKEHLTTPRRTSCRVSLRHDRHPEFLSRNLLDDPGLHETVGLGPSERSVSSCNEPLDLLVLLLGQQHPTSDCCCHLKVTMTGFGTRLIREPGPILERFFQALS